MARGYDAAHAARNLGAYASGGALVALGQLKEAQQLLASSRITVTTDPVFDLGGSALLGVLYARLGRSEDAKRIIAAAIPTAENRSALSHLHHPQFYIGAALAWLGKPDEAVQC